jgi:DNA-binding NarL/FixJ family response regulator
MKALMDNLLISALTLPMIPARLLLCDDQPLVRIRVRQFLKQTTCFEVVGEAVDGRSAVSMALSLRPDVVLMDVSMPDLNGIEATGQITAQAPGIRVLAYSANSDEDTIRRMFMAGAQGFLRKSGDPVELITALKKVLGGERVPSGDELFPGNHD